jgi:PAS domain S-box-containing protein
MNLTIGRRLKFQMGLSALVLLVIVLSVSWVSVTTARSLGNTNLLGEISKGVFELHNLTREHLLHPGERSVRQWHARHEALSSLLGDVNPEDRRSARLLNELADSHRDVKALYTKIIENEERGDADPEAKAASHDRLVGQLMMREQAMVSAATELLRLNRSRLLDMHKANSLFVIVLVTILASTVSGISYFLGRHIVRSLSRLREGTERIAGGDLAHRLNIEGRDEIAELSGSFDRMAESLAAAREDLGRKITEHRLAEAALRKTTELLETVFANTHLLIAYLDKDFSFIRVNKAYAEADGRDPESFVGKNHFALYPNEENEAIFRKVVETGEPFFVHGKPFVYPENPGRGVTYWDWSLEPVFEPDGSVGGLILSLKDVTERARAEEELDRYRSRLEDLVAERTAELAETNARLKRALDDLLAQNAVLEESEERFRTSIESMLDGFALLSAVRDAKWRIADFRFDYINETGCTMNEIGREAHIGKTLLEIYPEVGPTGLLRGYIRVAGTGKPFSVESHPYEGLFGGRKVSKRFDIRTFKVGDGVAVIWRDVTERKKAEEAVARLASFPELNPSPVVEVDPAGGVRYANPAARRLFPDLEEAGLSHPWLAGLAPVMDRFRREGTRQSFDAVNAGGRHYHRSLYYVEGARCIRIYGIDITGRMEAEEALRRSHEELEERIRERTAELSRSNADLRQFAYVASHDLQEPLRSIGSFTQLLANRYRGKLDADADDFIGFIVEGASRMQTLIDDLLIYSRVGTDGRPFTRVDGGKVLSKALANLRAAVAESGAAVTHDPLPIVMGDGPQFVQLFQNLLSNAVKFRENDVPRIHVSVKMDGNEWVFCVKDNGIGIDPRHADRIFAVFQRLHTRREYPGTGIGLAICKRIVERHGGRIWVESLPGEGSAFRFTIPAREV